MVKKEGMNDYVHFQSISVVSVGHCLLCTDETLCR